eukprot:Tbor_TRINITY_DN3464_c0_g1::TRINITY_DN3464_c0_g1_i1::g.3780::m.3780/K05016/CLCN7; chloride channel 7
MKDKGDLRNKWGIPHSQQGGSESNIHDTKIISPCSSKPKEILTSSSDQVHLNESIQAVASDGSHWCTDYCLGDSSAHNRGMRELDVDHIEDIIGIPKEEGREDNCHIDDVNEYSSSFIKPQDMHDTNESQVGNCKSILEPYSKLTTKVHPYSNSKDRRDSQSTQHINTKLQKGEPKELLMSRFMVGPGIFSKVRSVADIAQYINPVGATIEKGNEDQFGQWVCTANPTFESLDYEEHENIVLQEERARRKGSMKPPMWKTFIILFLIGFITGAVGFVIDFCLKYLMKWKFSAVEHFMTTPISEVNHTISRKRDDVPVLLPLLIYTSINCSLVAVAAALVILGEPLARGSGIGEIKCYLNGIRLFRVVRLKTLVCKAVGILFSVGAGLPCGKEGPMIHSGACIAAGVSTAKSSKFHFDTGLLKEFRNNREKRNFVTAGAAAGVGVAFGAPIGGLLFAVEEIGTYWSLELTVMVFICAAVAPWTLQLFNGLSNPSGILGLAPGLINFGSVTGDYYYRDLPLVALLGAIGGLLGAAFIKINILISKCRKRFVINRTRKFMEVIILTIIVSVTIILLVTRGYQCCALPSHMTDDMHKRIKRFGCFADEYNDMATYFFRPLEDSIHLLTHTDYPIKALTMGLYFVLFYIFTILVYGIHVPSGLFLPCLLLGAVLGRLYALTINTIFGWNVLEPVHYAVFGATAMLGGVVRATISVIVIIMETTGNSTFFYPLAVVTVVARLVGDLFTHGIYEEHLHAAHIPILDGQPSRPDMNLLAAGDIMNPNIVCITESISVGELVYVLKNYPCHNTLVVIDGEESCTLRGILTRREALILIEKRAWENNLNYLDFAKGANERVYVKLKKYKFFDQVLPEDDRKILCMARYIDQWPHTCHPTAPVSRVFRTLKELALGCIVVTTLDHKPVGIISRNEVAYLEMIDSNDITSELKKKFHTNREYHMLHYELRAHPMDGELGHMCASQTIPSFKESSQGLVYDVDGVRYGRGQYVRAQTTIKVDDLGGSKRTGNTLTHRNSNSRNRMDSDFDLEEYHLREGEGENSADVGTPLLISNQNSMESINTVQLYSVPTPARWRQMAWKDTYRKNVN